MHTHASVAGCELHRQATHTSWMPFYISSSFFLLLSIWQQEAHALAEAERSLPRQSRQTSRTICVCEACSQNAQASTCTISETNAQVWQGKGSGCGVTFWGLVRADTAGLGSAVAAGGAVGLAAGSSPFVADMLPLPACTHMQEHHQHDGRNISK